MGRKTRAAIRAYQGDEGLLQDGRPSRELRGHLERTRRNQTGSSAGSASAATSSSSGKSSAAELLRLLKERRKRLESARTTRERIQSLEKMLEKGLDRYEGTLSDNLSFVQMQERLARY